MNVFCLNMKLKVIFSYVDIVTYIQIQHESYSIL